MLLIAGSVLLLTVAAAAVLFWGAEALSLALFSALVEGDEALAVLPGEDSADGGENPGLPFRELAQSASRLSVPARLGLRWILWLVEWLEDRRPGVRRPLWALALGCAILFMRLGAAIDRVLVKVAKERERRRLGRRLLYEMVLAHRTS